jgi:hypothetical protein
VVAGTPAVNYITFLFQIALRTKTGHLVKTEAAAREAPELRLSACPSSAPPREADGARFGSASLINQLSSNSATRPGAPQPTALSRRFEAVLLAVL